jgi:hypothetical protein
MRPWSLVPRMIQSQAGATRFTTTTRPSARVTRSRALPERPSVTTSGVRARAPASMEVMAAPFLSGRGALDRPP